MSRDCRPICIAHNNVMSLVTTKLLMLISLISWTWRILRFSLLRPWIPVQFGRGRRRGWVTSARALQTHWKVSFWCQKGEFALSGTASAQAHDRARGWRRPASVGGWAMRYTRGFNTPVYRKQGHTTEPGDRDARWKSDSNIRAVNHLTAWCGWVAAPQDPVRGWESSQPETRIPTG